jgi:hypothetical protein
MNAGKIFDGVEAASTALGHDSLENEKVTVARGCIYSHALPLLGGHITWVTVWHEGESASGLS